MFPVQKWILAPSDGIFHSMNCPITSERCSGIVECWYKLIDSFPDLPVHKGWENLLALSFYNVPYWFTKCQALHLFTHCKVPMHRKCPPQFFPFLLKHFVWKIKSAVSNTHGFLLRFTVQFYSERTKCSDFSAQTSTGFISLFRPILRTLDSMCLLIGLCVQSPRVLPSPAESVHAGRSESGAPRSAVYSHCTHICTHTEFIWTYIKATAKAQGDRSQENTQ